MSPHTPNRRSSSAQTNAPEAFARADGTEKLQIKIGGMQCSFCVESIRKALTQMDGVGEVGVSLSHEEALVQYDPEKVIPRELRDTVRSLGYTVRDPNKVRTFEEEEAELRRHRNPLLLAAGFMSGSSISIRSGSRRRSWEMPRA